MKKLSLALVGMLIPGVPIRAAWAEAAAPARSAAAIAAEAAGVPLGFQDFLTRVARGNLELVAQRGNLPIAEAQVAIARVFPDPQLTAGLLQYDVTHQGNPTASIVGVSVPIQIGGQRAARGALAQANLAATRAELADFLRTLRGAAADAYIQALHARLVLSRKQLTLASLERLVAVNQERLKAGDIGEAALVQSRVEARQFHAAELGAEGEVRASDFELRRLMGNAALHIDTNTLNLQGDLARASARTFQLEPLLASAFAQRPDLLSARRRALSAKRQTELTRANRVVDVALGGTWQHDFATTQGVGAPRADLLGLTLSVPLPLSRMYHGDLDAAYAGELQSRAQVESIHLQVETDVRQALARYDAAAAQVKLYAEGVLSDADRVLEQSLYNYQRGGASLVEVLVAQRTVDDVYVAYYDALQDAGQALVALQLAAGLWEVQL